MDLRDVSTEVALTRARADIEVVHVEFQPHVLGSFHSTLYVRSDNDSVVIAQDVVLEGTGVLRTAVDEMPVAEFALTSVAPNPARDGVQVEFTVGRKSSVPLNTSVGALKANAPTRSLAIARLLK